MQAGVNITNLRMTATVLTPEVGKFIAHVSHLDTLIWLANMGAQTLPHMEVATCKIAWTRETFMMGVSHWVSATREVDHDDSTYDSKQAIDST